MSITIRRLAVLPIAALVAVCAGGAVAAAASMAPEMSPSAMGRMSLTVLVEDSKATVTPADFFSNPAVGETGVEVAPVSVDGKEVGTAHTVIIGTVVTDKDVVGILTCSVELAGGDLLFEGSFHVSQMMSGEVLPVIGGTGDYAGAIGTATLTATADGASTQVVFDIHQP
jgi:hypothetical protein